MNPRDTPHQRTNVIGHTNVEEDPNQGRIPQPGSTRLEIDQLLKQIEGKTCHQPVSAIFRSLLALLESISVLDSLQDQSSEETRSALDCFRTEANSLIDFMLARATNSEDIGEVLAETLDGISFALSHDVKRSFDSELKELNLNALDHTGKAKVAYVRGLLTNCLQQSVITLAQVFDPSLDGPKLFDNFQDRLRESLILCRDLADLLQGFRACEKDAARCFPILLAQVDRFRRESMRYLMYKDWQEFETLSEKLMDSAPGAVEPDSPAHSFKCYLETLLGQVKLRAVLVDVFCDFFPEGSETDPEWGEAQNRLAFELFRTELTSMIERRGSRESPVPEPV